eukprot:TRINITY_DN53617_c0_g1_i1.p1 TRINITY_DN53617_c0_g1~~TRINITY_DN53617_c0_g1_i1.p1  ORF type:complete len:100 (-),score=22.98 TRINITY_DN53617_c0_g1_i1:68-367(-)
MSGSLPSLPLSFSSAASVVNKRQEMGVVSPRLESARSHAVQPGPREEWRHLVPFNFSSNGDIDEATFFSAVSYTHLRAHETPEHLVCRLLLEKKKKTSI